MCGGTLEEVEDVFKNDAGLVIYKLTIGSHDGAYNLLAASTLRILGRVIRFSLFADRPKRRDTGRAAFQDLHGPESLKHREPRREAPAFATNFRGNQAATEGSLASVSPSPSPRPTVDFAGFKKNPSAAAAQPARKPTPLSAPKKDSTQQPSMMSIGNFRNKN